MIEPQLRGDPQALPELTLAEFVDVYLERHAVAVRGRTIAILRERLGYAIRAYGDVPLRDLERMSGELASWYRDAARRVAVRHRASTPPSARGRRPMGHIQRNPAKLAGPNRQPSPRTVRAFTVDELDAISEELSAIYRPLPAFAAATGLRPEEWAALEPRDIDRKAGHVTVCRTVSEDEQGRRILVELAKTSTAADKFRSPDARSTRSTSCRHGCRHVRLFGAPAGGLLNLDNFRRREWAPAIEASGVARPARIYDMRSTFASRAIAAGVPIFELAKIMGTSVRMIERHYGTLLDGAAAGIAARLDAFDAERESMNVHGDNRLRPR